MAAVNISSEDGGLDSTKYPHENGLSQKSKVTYLFDRLDERKRLAIQELFEMAKKDGSAAFILDVGCGLGETARFLATNFGSDVIGVELTEEFVSVGRVLTEKAGLENKVKLVRGSMSNLPFPDESFSIVLLDHISMNDASPAVFHEVSRVLKLSGRVLFRDVFAGSRAGVAELHDSVPNNCAVASFESVRRSAAEASLYIARCVDVTKKELKFLLSPQDLSHQHPIAGMDMGELDARMKQYMHDLVSGQAILLMGFMTKMGEPLELGS